MLGCKFLNAHLVHTAPSRINRYMLGCKSLLCVHDCKTNRELIDTCWDVNMHILEHLKRFRLRINRYMLGCKSACQGNVCCFCSELIDTCWDVNEVESSLKVRYAEN